MNEWAYIPRSELKRLFPIVICLDEKLKIVYASERMHHYMPEVVDGPRLPDLFDIRRPGNLETFEDALKALDSLCLMTAKNGRFAIRGQMLRTRYAEQQVLCFCGAPWLYWMARKCPEVKLGLSDFSPSDVQLDQLFFISTEKQMVADLENLNGELIQAKEHLENAHEANHRFFAQMSHEMRTPLNGVVSALALLEANPLDDSQEQLVSLARASSKNLMEVINYVLDLSKLELANEEPMVSFVLADLVWSTLEVVVARAREKSLDLKVRLAQDLPRLISSSPSRLRQCLLNLVMNAIKFTETGGILVRVEKLVSRDNNCTLRFTVTDTGIGISDEEQKHIFEPFWTTQLGTGGRSVQGTGLGLDIFRRNISHLGGDMGVKSRPGEGSSFWFDLPVVIVESLVESSEPKVIKAAVDLGVVQLAGHILLVDDNETNLLLGAMILETMGLKVTTATGGVAAIEAVRNIDPDLILMDIHMPDMDGIETTKQLRQLDEADRLRIVALTALAYDGEKQRCIDAGMNGYLTKPIEREELARELMKWLPLKNAGETLVGEKNRSDTASEPPVLEPAVLQKMARQIGPANVQVVLTKVLVEAEQRWEDLQLAQKKEDIPAMQRNAHSLSSIYRSVGLMLAADRLADVEFTLRGGGVLEAGWLDMMSPLQSESLSMLGVERDNLATDVAALSD